MKVVTMWEKKGVKKIRKNKKKKKKHLLDIKAQGTVQNTLEIEAKEEQRDFFNRMTNENRKQRCEMV